MNIPVSRIAISVALGVSVVTFTTAAQADSSDSILSQLRQDDGTVGARSAPAQTSVPANELKAQVQEVNWQPPIWSRAASQPAGLNAQGAAPAAGNQPCCESSGLGFSAMLGWDTEHIFRGSQEAEQNAVAEIELSYRNLYGGVWGMLPTNDGAGNFASRVDVYGGATFDLSRSVYADVGVTGYLYPDGGTLVPGEDSVEGYVGFGFNNAFNPAIYGYYDVVRERYTAEASAEYRIPVARTDFVLGATAGYTGSTGGGLGQDYAYVRADAEIVQNINRHASIGIGGHFAWSSEDTFLDNLAYTQDTTEWFGIRLRAKKD